MVRYVKGSEELLTILAASYETQVNNGSKYKLPKLKPLHMSYNFRLTLY